MNSYERVMAGLEFKVPDKLPLSFSALGKSDFHKVSWNQYVDYLGSKEGNDFWACGWKKTEQDNMGLIVSHPIDNWDNLEDYQWPNPDDPKFYKDMEIQFENAKDKFVITDLFMLLFERMQGLRGMENILMDFYLEPKKIEELADKIMNIQIKFIQNIAKRFGNKIHGLTFTEDWGTETALMIDPAMWKTFFKPRYKKIFDAAKDAGWKLIMHSCGKIDDIIEDLIDLGVDSLNLQQPRVYDIVEFGKRFAGRICFSSLCDIQHTLPFKDNNYIQEEAKLLLENWSTEKGGFILTDYGDGAAIGVNDSKKEVMLEAFLENDPWL